jgi:hypothetical protein
MVVMIAVPDSVPQQVFTTTEQLIWNWLEEERGRRYPPDLNVPFLRGKPKGMFGGVIIQERSDHQTANCAAIERSGVIELAASDRASWIQNGRLFYHAAGIVGSAWQFLGFSCDFHRTFNPKCHSGHVFRGFLPRVDGADRRV